MLKSSSSSAAMKLPKSTSASATFQLKNIFTKPLSVGRFMVIEKNDCIFCKFECDLGDGLKWYSGCCFGEDLSDLSGHFKMNGYSEIPWSDNTVNLK